MDDFPLLFHLLFFETNMAIKAPKSEKRATLSQWKTSGPQNQAPSLAAEDFYRKKKTSPKPDQSSQEMHQEMPIFWRMFLRKIMEATMTHLPADCFPLLVAVDCEAAVVRELHFHGQAFLPWFGEAWMKGPQMLGTRPFHKDYMTLPNVIGQILMSLAWICLFWDQLGWGSVYSSTVIAIVSVIFAHPQHPQHLPGPSTCHSTQWWWHHIPPTCCCRPSWCPARFGAGSPDIQDSWGHTQSVRLQTTDPVWRFQNDFVIK